MALAADKCEDFTISNCVPSKDSEAGTLPPVSTATQCQAACADSLGCTHFSQQTNPAVSSDKCLGYTQTYIQDCGVYGAKADTQLDECMAMDGQTDCDVYTKAECLAGFDDANIYYEADEGTIADANHCQDMCVLLEPDCVYWLFYNPTATVSTRCLIYTFYDVSQCTTILGPKENILPPNACGLSK